VITVKKLDGSTMHLNEDLIERVEDATGGQCVVYQRDGGHIIAANSAPAVVEMIREEKVALWRRVLEGPGGPGVAPHPSGTVPGVTKLSQVRGK
jgi:uncharacterized protein YlzI (FlbEa/FlbD family)